MAEEYQREDWVSRYNSALTELEQSKLLSRITSAQDAIVDRLEKLRMMPDLHPEERRAIEHAIRTLGSGTTARTLRCRRRASLAGAVSGKTPLCWRYDPALA